MVRILDNHSSVPISINFQLFSSRFVSKCRASDRTGLLLKLLVVATFPFRLALTSLCGLLDANAMALPLASDTETGYLPHGTVWSVHRPRISRTVVRVLSLGDAPPQTSSCIIPLRFTQSCINLPNRPFINDYFVFRFIVVIFIWPFEREGDHRNTQPDDGERDDFPIHFRQMIIINLFNRFERAIVSWQSRAILNHPTPGTGRTSTIHPYHTAIIGVRVFQKSYDYQAQFVGRSW